MLRVITLRNVRASSRFYSVLLLLHFVHFVDQLQVMHGVSHCLYLFTRNKRFLAGSVLKLMNSQVKCQRAIQI